MIELLVAYDINRCIGKSGEIPWRIPDDMKRVKAQSLGKAVIMGRKTWESIPSKFRPLPGRTNIVITSQNLDVPESVFTYPSVEAALLAHQHETIIGFGGQRIFEALLPLADRIYLTEVNQTVVNGDTFFPVINKAEWRTITTESHKGYIFKTLERIR